MQLVLSNRKHLGRDSRRQGPDNSPREEHSRCNNQPRLVPHALQTRPRNLTPVDNSRLLLEELVIISLELGLIVLNNGIQEELGDHLLLCSYR